jgi:hypothetical protein
MYLYSLQIKGDPNKQKSSAEDNNGWPLLPLLMCLHDAVLSQLNAGTFLPFTIKTIGFEGEVEFWTPWLFVNVYWGLKQTVGKTVRSNIQINALYYLTVWWQRGI